MKRKASAFVMAAVLCVGAPMSAFCGGTKDVPSSNPTATVRIMGYGGQDPAVVVRLLDEVIGADLKAKGIELRYEPLEGDYNAMLYNALSAGTAGDIVYIPGETAPGIIATGKILPLDGRIDPKPFIPSLIETFTVDGKLYGIAKDFNTLAMVYNKDLFDDAKVPYPDEKDTWQSLADKIRRVRKLGPEVYGAAFIADYARFGAFPFSAGWAPFDKKGSTNLLDPAFAEAARWYVGLVREGAAVQPQDLGQGWTGGALATEKVGIAFEGAWILGYLRNEAPNIEFGVAPMPIGPSGKRGNFIYTVAYGINKDSKNIEAATEVLKALTGEKAQQFILEQGLALPSRSALADNPYLYRNTPESAANRVIFKGAADGHVRGYQFGKVGTDWFAPINAALAESMTGKADIDAALTRAQREIEALIDRAR